MSDQNRRLNSRIVFCVVCALAGIFVSVLAARLGAGPGLQLMFSLIAASILFFVMDQIREWSST